MQLVRATNPVILDDGGDVTAIEMARAGSLHTARAVLCPRKGDSGRPVDHESIPEFCVASAKHQSSGRIVNRARKMRAA
jgi:hypothetical protein